MKKTKLVRGVGVNDADYVVLTIINGKKIMCPFYLKWSDMLNRCYSDKCQEKFPTYVGCTVCDEWLIFSVFKRWMEKQKWQGMHLDKDLLVEGNKRYSPDTCVFVDRSTNTLLNDRAAARGHLPIGVAKNGKGYRSVCRNGGNKVHLRTYPTEEQAHAVYVGYKTMVITAHANKLTDQRVKSALILRSNNMMSKLKPA